jgi:hypothetical protein
VQYVTLIATNPRRSALNIQEREQLSQFLQQLQGAQVGTKDAEAERLIQETCRQQADANYLLVQRSMLLGQALATAQAEIARLQQALESPQASSNSFLGGNAWGNTPVAPVVGQPRSTGLAPAAPIPPAAVNPSSWGSGMLGTVATTAAGVVAGAFLFQGIEHLMGNHNSSNGLLSENKSSHEPTPAPAEHLLANADSGNVNNDFANLGPDDSSDPDWT